MNNDEMEKKLLENGFTSNDINHMKKVIQRGIDDGDVKETLLTLTQILNQRFYNGCLIIFILILALVINITLRTSMDSIEIIVYCIVTAIAILVACYITPINLAYKSYVFLKKQKRQG